MTYRDAKPLTARGQIQFKFAKRVAKLVNTFQCLIVSANPQRREMLERAADDGGWKTSLCSDPGSAMTHLSRAFVQLAVVDLEGQQIEGFRPLVEQLTARSGLLLVVCGNEGKADEEIWVRQSGAWLYLPGVVESSNFALLCGEARHIAERLCKTNSPERVSGSAAAQRKSFT